MSVLVPRLRGTVLAVGSSGSGLRLADGAGVIETEIHPPAMSLPNSNRFVLPHG